MVNIPSKMVGRRLPFHSKLSCNWRNSRSLSSSPRGRPSSRWRGRIICATSASRCLKPLLSASGSYEESCRVISRGYILVQAPSNTRWEKVGKGGRGRWYPVKGRGEQRLHIQHLAETRETGFFADVFPNWVRIFVFCGFVTSVVTMQVV
jgi:hypothetical protein